MPQAEGTGDVLLPPPPPHQPLSVSSSPLPPPPPPPVQLFPAQSTLLPPPLPRHSQPMLMPPGLSAGNGSQQQQPPVLPQATTQSLQSPSAPSPWYQQRPKYTSWRQRPYAFSSGQGRSRGSRPISGRFSQPNSQQGTTSRGDNPHSMGTTVNLTGDSQCPNMCRRLHPFAPTYRHSRHFPTKRQRVSA